MYTRMIPRDLFNESMLLKCFGQLSLLIEDEVDANRNQTPKCLSLEYDCDHPGGFCIERDDASGDLVCRNMTLLIDGEPLDVYHPSYNRDPFPMVFDDGGDNTGDVFNPDGTLSGTFRHYLETRCQTENTQ